MRNTLARVDFNEKLGGIAYAPIHIELIVSAMRYIYANTTNTSTGCVARVCIAFRSCQISWHLRHDWGYAIYRVGMFRAMHERVSLNYRHHVKSYFITVIVWAYSFQPSVSIKFDERRRRRWRHHQAPTPQSCNANWLNCVAWIIIIYCEASGWYA